MFKSIQIAGFSPRHMPQLRATFKHKLHARRAFSDGEYPRSTPPIHRGIHIDRGCPYCKQGCGLVRPRPLFCICLFYLLTLDFGREIPRALPHDCARHCSYPAAPACRHRQLLALATLTSAPLYPSPKEWVCTMKLLATKICSARRGGRRSATFLGAPGSTASRSILRQLFQHPKANSFCQIPHFEKRSFLKACF